MNYSKDSDYTFVANKISKLAMLMQHDYGKTTDYWISIIQKSNFYSSIMDLKTHLWSEGPMYLQDLLVSELKLRGIL